jgi:hypothetical protein
VDPQTGAWLAEAQIGGGTSPAREGDLFEILAFVTSENLQAGKPEALHFDRPVDIPGVVFISPFVDLTVGAR